MIIVAPLYNFCSPDFCRFTFRESRPADLVCSSLCTRCGPGLRSVYPSLQAANVICDLACISGCPCPFLQQRWPVLLPSSAAAHVLARNINSSCHCVQSPPLAISSAAAASVFVLAYCSRSSCSLQQQLFFCTAANVICDLACSSGCPRSFLQQQWPVLVSSSAAALVLVFNLNCPRSCGQPRQLAFSTAAAASVLSLLLAVAALALCSSSCSCVQQQMQYVIPHAAAGARFPSCSSNCPRLCRQQLQLSFSS
jgi:hypothetical protein